MICVPIAGSNKQALGNIREAQRIADITEIRLDLIADADIKQLRKASEKPIIITNRTSCKEQLASLKAAIKLGAEYVDIEASCGEKCISELKETKGSTKLIVSHHDFNSTPDSIEETYQRIRKTGCDIVKIATTANDITDNTRIFELCQKAKKDKQPIIALCMGEKGEISRILYKTFGSILTYASLKEGSETAAGQITAKLMKETYRADKLNPDTEIYGVIGKPAKYSRGIYIFNPAYKAMGINKAHLKFEVDNLQQFLTHASKLNIKGFAVTTPYKEEIIPYLHEIEPTASKMGAVNTVKIENGKLKGYNTDGNGAKLALLEKTNIKGKNITIIGAGGAAKAIAHELAGECHLTILNRTVDRAKEIAEKINCRYGSIDELREYDILINCTTVGMLPKANETPVPKERLKNTVMDIIYKPPVTRLLREAREQGCQTIDGMSMLLQQARRQFMIWTGKEPPLEIMRESLWKSLSSP